MPNTVVRQMTQAWLEFCQHLTKAGATGIELSLSKEELLRRFVELNEGREYLPLALRFKILRGPAGFVLDLAHQILKPYRVGGLFLGAECVTILTFTRDETRELLGDMALHSADVLIQAKREALATAAKLADYDQKAVASARQTADGVLLLRTTEQANARLRELTTGESLPKLAHP